jgi:hypothetical protein
MSVTLFPPPDKAPFKRVKLHSGSTVFPDFANGGRVVVADEIDARDLEGEGWTRSAASAKAAAYASDLLRKAYASDLRRNVPGIGSFEHDRAMNDGQLAEFTVRIGSEKMRVKRTDTTISISGVEVSTDSLAPEVRRQLAIATSRLDAASFDLDGDLVGLYEARNLIVAAITAVMHDKAFRDRLIAEGTRRVGSHPVPEQRRI